MSESFRNMFATPNQRTVTAPRMVDAVAQLVQAQEAPIVSAPADRGWMSTPLWKFAPAYGRQERLPPEARIPIGDASSVAVTAPAAQVLPTMAAAVAAPAQAPSSAQPPMPRVIEMAPPETPMSMGQALRFLAAVKGPSPQDLALAQALEHVNRTENRSQAYRATLSPDAQKKFDAEQKLGYLPQLLSVAGSGGGGWANQLTLNR